MCVELISIFYNMDSDNKLYSFWTAIVQFWKSDNSEICQGDCFGSG